MCEAADVKGRNVLENPIGIETALLPALLPNAGPVATY